MLTKCVNCGFYAEQVDKFCLNCGIKNPGKEFSQASDKIITLLKIIRLIPIKLLFTAFLIFFLLFAISDWNISGIFYLRDYILFLVFISGVGLSFLTLFLLENWGIKHLNPQRQKKADSLSSRKKLIEKRLFALDKRSKGIDLILSRINENSGEQIKDMRPKLLAAREMIISQYARYELQKQKIELVQIQNGVSPYLFGLHRLNEVETEDGLATIENTRREIDKIRQNLTRYDAIEFPAKVLPDKQLFLSQLDETENSCEKLGEALLSLQAAHTLKDIQPAKAHLTLPEIEHTSEVFNIQIDLTDFSESFEELEREYQRLQAESEISQNILSET